MKIYWKDFFKPRYAIIVEIEAFPRIQNGEVVDFNNRAPVVKRLPVKRPLSMPFGIFYNRLSEFNNLVFTGSKRTLLRIDGIGSCLPHNVANAVTLN